MLALLKKLNIIADVANNGQEAVQLAQKNKYPLVFMDIEMPIMDGKTATAIIRTFDPYKMIPIIAVTAHVISEPEKRRLEKDPGFTCLLTKPLSFLQLQESVNQYMNKFSVLPP